MINNFEICRLDGVSLKRVCLNVLGSTHKSGFKKWTYFKEHNIIFPPLKFCQIRLLKIGFLSTNQQQC